MSKGETLRDLTSTAIIDSAATLISERGEAASMEEIAAAAGVGRATLYRYFPSRDALLEAMAATSIRELAARIAEADLETVAFPEAIARLARAIIATGSRYIAVSGESARYSATRPEFNTGVIEPIAALFQRAHTAGLLRTDLPPELAMDLFGALVRGALNATAAGGRSAEEAATAVTAVFLDGARGS